MTRLTVPTTTVQPMRLSQLRSAPAPAVQEPAATRALLAHVRTTLMPAPRGGGSAMAEEIVRVRVLLVVGDQAEIVADVEDPAAPERYPAAVIAEAVGVSVADLPGRRLLAEVGRDDRLSGWRLA
ncbi:hypothetical protein GCM10010193_70330 [Kitasatospora atroaurantiaca]|uniref:Uncharacterized protein n=1 Tax=Kitasatospora atroaurantiaca TaxID=285545 RepID=A0A561END7_9ACTN|nr:hypothetical protein [Kitasatospora atroaurantiaca]TWE17120.1 hypothetical protein FB465_2125 [Kitasatospora atroaurantiaca]